MLDLENSDRGIKFYFNHADGVCGKINKEYFRKKFEEIFRDYSYHLRMGLSMKHEKDLLDELMKCFDTEN